MKESRILAADELVDDLNEEQRRAVLHAGGPLLVLAGPGSGKTRVITRRIAYRIRSSSLEPRQILGITFTNRAAEEMKVRLRALLDPDAAVQVGTFHWLCNAVLRKYIDRLGYRRDFRLLGPRESRKALLAALDTGSSRDLQVRPVADGISAIKNGATMESVIERNRLSRSVLSGALEKYHKVLRHANALDLDDLLALALQLLESDQNVRASCMRAHEEILVDEYQDVNPVQRALLKLLAPESRTVVAVGDEDQAIYSWRQADVEAILRFEEDFPGAATVTLQRTYRSSQQILRAASAVVQHNRRRTSKILRTVNPPGEKPFCFVANDEVEEASWISQEIERLASRDRRPWSDFAVMYRVNAQARVLESALLRSGIPYQVHGSRRFYDQPEVARALAYLRVSLEPDDDAVARLLEDVSGIGPRRLGVLLADAKDRSVPLLAVLQEIERISSLPPQVRKRVGELTARIENLRAERHGSLSRVVESAVRAVTADLDLLTPTLYDAALENLQELRSAAREVEARKGTLRELVDRAALHGDEGTRHDGVHCLSLHAAKGTEFPIVFIAGMEEGLIPHHRSLDRELDVEEERRLCYVGMTRAKERLSISYARTRLLAGQALSGHASRFLGEMGSSNINLHVSPSVSTKPRLHSVAPGQRVMHSRWKAGTVVEIEGKGRDTLVTIVFDRVGRQRLQLCHAPLSPISAEQSNVLA